MKSANFLSFTAWHLVFGLNVIFGYINKSRKTGKISKKAFLCQISTLTASLEWC